LIENRKTPPVLQVALALAAVYVIWGSTYLAMAMAIETIPPFLMAGARYLIAGGVLYLWVRKSGAPRPTRVHWRSALLIGGLLLLGGNGGVVWAEQKVPSGIAALLVSMVPLWMVLMDWLRPAGTRPNWKVLTGVALGFAGLLLLVRPTAGLSIDPLGVAALLLATLSWAWGSLRSRSVELPASPLLATAMEMLGGGGLLLVAGLVTGETAGFHLAAVSMRSLLALGYLITFGALVGFTAYVWLLRVAPPALVGTYAYVNPIVAVFLGWLVLGEPLTGRTLVAAAVIISGVVLITLARRAPAPAARSEREPLTPPAPLSHRTPIPRERGEVPEITLNSVSGGRRSRVF
jgi:drug/metabolite transporter (DMT)-like permease